MFGRLVVLSSVLLALGCSGGKTEPGADVPDAVQGDTTDAMDVPSAETGLFESRWWEIGDESGLLELLDISPFFQERSWLVLEASSWFDHVVHEVPGEVPEDSSWLGYFGIGNGFATSFVGTWYPFNTLHELLGPDYQKEELEGYFADYAVFLEHGGSRLKWSQEWIWKPLMAQLAVTRMQVDGSPLELDTVSFAPASEDLGPEARCIVQVINVRNTGTEIREDVGVTVQSFFWGLLPDDVQAIEQTRGGDRMRARPLGDGWERLDKSGDDDYPAMRSPTFTLEPGQERQLVMVYEFAEEADPIGAGLEAVETLGWGQLLDDTAAWWKSWHLGGLVVRTPDRKVNDLIEGLKGTIKVMIADTGAASELSHYTGAWHRDTYPPVRTMLKFGYPEEAGGMTDYIYGAAAVEGAIGNALPCDLILPDPLPEVDWMAAVPFTHDRLRGEGPSFLPLMNLLMWQYTGAAQPLLDRWDYLMHTLRGQTITDEGLMYFSGDETFRVLYAFNIGLGLEWDFVNGAFSTYSAFLFVRAAEMLAGFIESTGADKAADLAWLKDTAADLRKDTDDHYWVDAEGRYASMIYQATMEPESVPGEDLNTQPVWLGYHDRDHELARQNLLGTMEDILDDQGMLITSLGKDEELMGYNVGRGLLTGMTPGYFLFDGAELNLEVAGQTFDLMGKYVSRSGNYPEVGVYIEPGRALCPFYDPTGAQGELWARFRQWEGAINLEALMHYIVGFEANVVEGWMALSPRLPHDAPFIEADNVPFAGHGFDLRYAREGEGHQLTLTGDADPDSYGLKEFRVRLNVPGDEVKTLELDGEPMEPATWTKKAAFPGLTEVSVVIPAPASGSFTLMAL